VPTLHVLGWYDAEDFYSPLEVYKKMERKDSNDWNYLVVGPWTPGSWTRGTGQNILEVDLGSETGRFHKGEIEAAWFAYWLKDEGTLDLPKVQAFRTGANVSETFDSWPPSSRTTERDIYLQPRRGLSFEPRREPQRGSIPTTSPSPWGRTSR
jgi:predicted acyl esterase